MKHCVDRETDWSSTPLGTPVIVRCLDHVRFESLEAARHKPFQLEMIRWLDSQGKDTVRVFCEGFAEPKRSGDARVRSSFVEGRSSTISAENPALGGSSMEPTRFIEKVA